MFRRFFGSLSDGRTPRRSAAGVPVLFAPRRGLVAGGRGGRRLAIAGSGIAIDGELDWGVREFELHAMEYLACLDDAEVVSLVDSWTASGRDARDERALPIRCAVWMREISARGDSLPRDFVARASRSIAEQIRSLEEGARDLSSLKALILAGRFFSGPEADRWAAIGVERLEAHVRMDLPSFADLLECRAIVAHPGLAGTLDAIAQAAVDLSTEALPVECLRVHAALGGRVPTARPAFAYEAEGCFGLRGDESFFLARDGTFHWSIGGMPFVLDAESDRWRVEDVLLREGQLRLTSFLGDRRRTLRASLDRIDVEEELAEGAAKSLRTELRLHPAVDVRIGPDARSALLVRKGVSVTLESPSPMRVVTDGERKLVVHHGMAPCTGELTLRHVPESFGSAASLDAIASLARGGNLREAPPPTLGPGTADPSPIRTGSSRRR